MIVIKEYHFSNFGFTLPAACVEVSEVQSTKQQQYYDNDSQTSKNTLVRIKVWASETAKIDGLQPLEQIDRFIDLDSEMTNDIHNTALLALFPDATTKSTTV